MAEHSAARISRLGEERDSCSLAGSSINDLAPSSAGRLLQLDRVGPTGKIRSKPDELRYGALHRARECYLPLTAVSYSVRSTYSTETGCRRHRPPRRPSHYFFVQPALRAPAVHYRSIPVPRVPPPKPAAQRNTAQLAHASARTIPRYCLTTPAIPLCPVQEIHACDRRLFVADAGNCDLTSKA